MLAGKHQWPAADQSLQFGEGDDRTGKGDGADRHADRHLDQTGALDSTRHTDAKILWRAERRDGDADRGEANQAVERRHQLRQRRHLNLQRDVCPNGSADNDTGDDQPIADHVGNQQRRDNGDHHAGDAVQIAGSRRSRRGQAAQRQDETNGRYQIEKGGEVSAHELPRYLLR